MADRKRIGVRQTSIDPPRWQITQGRRDTHFYVEQDGEGFHLLCSDTMKFREQGELKLIAAFPHQQAAIHHAWLVYLKRNV